MYALCALGGELFAGGFFACAGDEPAPSIAKWDGGRWASLGAGTTYSSGPGAVNAVVRAGSELLVGGTFDTAGGRPATNIALWHMPPALGIRREGDAAIVSWPATGTNYVLESKTEAGASNWSEVSPPASVVADECLVTTVVEGRQKLYRLRR